VKWILPTFKPFTFFGNFYSFKCSINLLAWHDAIVRKTGQPRAAPSMPREMPVLLSPCDLVLLTLPLEGKECISTSSLRKK